MIRQKQNGEHRFRNLAKVFIRISEHWLPAPFEDEDEFDQSVHHFDDLDSDDDDDTRLEKWNAIDRQQSLFHERNTRRRIFLFLSQPNSSFGSAVFFGILVLTINLSIVIMILQTMRFCQYTPKDCLGCGGTKVYPFVGEFIPSKQETGVPCVCPPTPLTITVAMEDILVDFFALEWTARVLLFEPPTHERADTFRGFLNQWFSFVTSLSMIIDALSIFPYYFTKIHGAQSLLVLRMVKLFRVFPLLRLGQFNTTFQSLLNVLSKAVQYLRILIIVLGFGCVFFGSMMYYLERGLWKFYDPTEQYEFVRVSANGITEEISPFRSIPEAFWWFMVTVVTLGYGDTYPTSVGGKIVAVFAMLLGILVIAFPVSVFSDLWSKELSLAGVIPDSPKPVADNSTAYANSNRNNNVGDSDDDSDDDSTRRDSFFDAKTPVHATGKTAGRVYLSNDDLTQLKKSMETIEKHQRMLAGILRKYEVNDDY